MKIKSPFLEAALAATEVGFDVFPLQPGLKIPAVKGWQEAATSNPKAVRCLWADRPNANIGVAAGGELRLLVLDVDGNEGRRSLKALEQQHGRLPRTVEVRTPRGRHYYFRNDDPLRNSVAKLGPGLDVRADGGYVVGAGSVNDQGAQYRYAKGRSPDEIEMADFPDWVVARLQDQHDRKGSLSSGLQSGMPTLYGATALKKEADVVRKAPNGTRNDRLNKAAFSLGQLVAAGEIDAEEVKTILTSAAQSAGLEPAEIQATIDSGLSAGQAQPRKRHRRKGRQSNKSSQSDTLLVKLAKLDESDTDNAQRLLKRYGDHLQFVPERRRWFVFDGQRWREDTGDEHVSRAQELARLIANEAAELDDGERRRKREQWGQQSLGASSIKRALEMARPHAARSIAEFDADPWLLNARNGTLDLRTGRLRSYNPSDYLTRLTGTSYDPAAKCPRFKRLLREIFPDDEELIAFLRRYVGYTLTGSTREQCFLFLHGEGKNGKSTLIGILQEMLGDYARTVAKGTLLAKFHTGSIPNDLARLAGARMVSAIESNPNEQLDEALVKQITGGDRISARFLYGEFFEFTPELKLWYAANHPPRLRSTDEALWRRIHVLPFEVAVPMEQVDPDLLVRLRTELPGILTWAVRGCRRWQEVGLQPPDRVVNATRRYRKEVDHVRRFIQECLARTNGPPTRSNIVYDRYERWCSENGERGISMKALAAKLTEAGFSRRRIPGSGHRAWDGLTLRE